MLLVSNLNDTWNVCVVNMSRMLIHALHHPMKNTDMDDSSSSQ